MSQTFVVQWPQSQTNPSPRWRVVDFDKWMAYVNHTTSAYPYASYDNYEEARQECDRRNDRSRAERWSLEG